MKYTIEQIKDWRRRIDTLANSCNMLDKSRENSLVLTNLQLAKMWLGEVLKDNGTKNPYPESMNPDSPVIEPQAEHSTDTIFNGELPSQVARVKLLRAKIEEIVSEIKEAPSSINTTQVYVGLVNAKMWAGMQLNTIRENTNKEETKTN